MPDWYLRLTYIFGRTPYFYVGKNRTKETLYFIAINQIQQNIYETPHGLYLDRKKLSDRHIHYNRI